MTDLVGDPLSRAGIFSGVDAAVVADVARRLVPVEFSRGTTVFREGQDGDALYVIIDGKVKIGRRNGDGRANLLALLGPSDMFGELSMFDPGKRTSSATAVTDVRARSMARATLLSWIERRPELSEQLLRVLARRLRRTNDTMADLIFTDVAGRVAKQLLELATRFGTPDGDGVYVHHELTQGELAQLVGASRETVNKALSAFVGRGWIRIEGKGVLIRRMDRMQRRAGLTERPREQSPPPDLPTIRLPRTKPPRQHRVRVGIPVATRPEALAT